MNDLNAFLTRHGVSIAALGLVIAALLLTVAGSSAVAVAVLWVCAALAVGAAVRSRRAD